MYHILSKMPLIISHTIILCITTKEKLPKGKSWEEDAVLSGYTKRLWHQHEKNKTSWHTEKSTRKLAYFHPGTEWREKKKCPLIYEQEARNHAVQPSEMYGLQNLKRIYWKLTLGWSCSRWLTEANTNYLWNNLMEIQAEVIPGQHWL